MAKPILKLFQPHGRLISLVFWIYASVPNSKGTHSSGSLNTRGEFAIFDWNRRLSRKWYEIGSWLPINVQYNGVILTMVYVKASGEHFERS